MATPCKPGPQDSVLSCPICMDTYKTPRMLPCQHTLCESCLHSYIVNKSRERVLVSDFPCPVCRASTPAPRAFTRIDTWASLFPLNHLLVSLLDSSFQELLDRSGSESGIERCLEHAAKLIEFFCTEHNVKICSKCFKNSHRQCDVIDIEDHIEFTSRFGTVKSDIDNVLHYLNEIIAHLKANIEQLSVEKSSIMNEVKEFRNKVEALLNSFETDVRDQVNVQHDGEVVVLKAQCEKYERIKSEIDTSENSIAKLPASSDIPQALESISSVENELKSHLSFLAGCHSNVKVIKLGFTIEDQLLSFLNTFSQIGNVYTEQFEANVKKPPDLLSRGVTQNESFVPSPREIAGTPELNNSPSSSRHQSPRGLVTRSTASCQLTTNQQSRTPPRKEHKRPLTTVPVQSATPTPIVRPRPERPEVRGIPHFLPGSFSSPVNDTSLEAMVNVESSVYSVATAAVDEERKNEEPQYEVARDIEDDYQLAREIESNNPEYPTTFHSDLDNLSPPANSAINSLVLRPASGNVPRHRVWQYVNIDPFGKKLENSLTTENGEVGERTKRQVDNHMRIRSASTSDIKSDTGKCDTVSATAERVVSEPGKGRVNTSQPLYENTASASPPKLGSERKKFAPRHCIKINNICVRNQEDKQPCTITDSVKLDGQRLVLIDCNNSRLKLLNNDMKRLAYLDFSKEPWNGTALPSNEIAVTVPLEKSIHVIRVTDCSLEATRSIGTRRECWGIGYVDGRFVVTTKDDGNLVIFLDRTGRELQLINFASRENPNILRPVSVSISHRDNALYISCEGQSGTKGSVVKMTSRGDIQIVLTNKDLDRPYSSALDADDNVLVTALRSSNVMAFMDGGGKALSLLSRDSGLVRPQHIQVVQRAEESMVFFLSERRSDCMGLYEVK